MCRAAAFDLDGTLVDSLPGIASGLNAALAFHGHPSHPPERVQSFIGNGSWMLVKRGLPRDPSDATVDNVLETFFNEYEKSWRGGTVLYPGIRELLLDLHHDGVVLAVLSNKPHRFTVDIMKELFSFVPFAAVLGQGPEVPRKPDPTGALRIARELNLPPGKVAYIGDSTIDYETAVAAGMQPFLVSWGFHPTERLAATGAPLLHSAADLRRVLREPHPAE